MADTAPAGAGFDALRAHGADRLDPTRWAFMQALARRTSAWQGPVRQRLEARLAGALAHWQAELDAAAASAPPGVPSWQALPAAAVDTPAALAALAALAARARDPSPTTDPADAGGPACPPRPDELRALQRYRREWTQLRAEQRVAGALAQVPAKAGPLHSTGLALRAVQLMRALSPGCLQHLVVHADALLWLEAATGDDALPLPSPVRGGGDRRPRVRSGR